jgi:hypothetical protein
MDEMSIHMRSEIILFSYTLQLNTGQRILLALLNQKKEMTSSVCQT